MLRGAALGRVCAAFWAARLRPVLPLVRTAFVAARCRAAAPRVRAELRACLARFLGDAAECLSRLSACDVARERLAEGFCLLGLWPLRISFSAFFGCSRVS